MKEVTFHQLSQSRGGRERLEEVARGQREAELCYRARLGSLESPLLAGHSPQSKIYRLKSHSYPRIT